jgi:ABC-type sugar transport system, periplasmic component
MKNFIKKNGRRISKVISICLSLVMVVTLFSGCGSKDTVDKTTDISQPEQEYGEYIISQIQELTRVFSFQEADNTYYVVGSTENQDMVLYSSADAGLNWTAEEIDVAGVLPEGYYIDAADTDGAGNLVLEYSVLDSERNITESKVVKVAKEGTADELFDCGGKIVGRLKYSSKKDGVYLYMDSDIYKLDMEGGESYSINIPDLIDFCVTDSKVIALTEDMLYIYDSETGKKQEDDDQLTKMLSNEINATARALYSDTMNCKNILQAGQNDGNTIYLMLEEGIYSYSLDGALVLYIVNNVDNHFANNQILSYDYIVDYGTDGEAEKFVTVCSADTGRQIAAYSTDALETNIDSTEDGNSYADEPEAEITVYSLQNEDYMEELIRTFENIHPNITVNYTYGYSEDSGITAEDAVNALNTELLSGGGADVILMDGLDVDRYAESGTLMELSDIYNEILAENPDCLETVMQTYKTESGIYAIPSNVALSVLVGPEADIQNMDDIEALTNYIRESEKPNYGNDLNIYDVELLFNILYASYEVELINADGSYNEEALEKFLTEFKELWEALMNHTSSEELSAEHSESMASYIEPLYDREYSGQQITLAQMMENINGIAAFYSMKHNEGSDNETMAYKVLGNGGKKVYTPMNIFAINENSQKKEAAASFVKEMFGVELQKIYYGYQGEPVNTEAFYASNEYYKGIYDIENMVFNSYGNVEKKNWRFVWDEKDIAEYIETLKTLDTPSYNNLQIRETVWTGLEAYVNDEKTLDDSLKEIRQSLELYLSE